MRRCQRKTKTTTRTIGEFRVVVRASMIGNESFGSSSIDGRTKSSDFDLGDTLIFCFSQDESDSVAVDTVTIVTMVVA